MVLLSVEHARREAHVHWGHGRPGPSLATAQWRDPRGSTGHTTMPRMEKGPFGPTLSRTTGRPPVRVDVETEIKTTDGREQGDVCPTNHRAGVFDRVVDSFRVLSRAFAMP